jgi:ribosomal protein S18 acetylase RimI-like enzyme
VIVRQLVDADRSWLLETVEALGGLPVVSTSGLHDPTDLPGFVAQDENGRRVGAATYRIADGGCEVVTLAAEVRGTGVGTLLLGAVRAVADAGGARLWLITTNDNVGAQRFYERSGMRVVAVHANFVETVRAAKPGRTFGFRDAIEYAY